MIKMDLTIYYSDPPLTQKEQECTELRKTIESYKAKDAVGRAESYLSGGVDVGGLKVVTVTLPDTGADALRQMGDFLRDRAESVVAVLAAPGDEKLTFLAVCGKAAVSRGVCAGDIIKSVTKLCGGSGGGKPDSAMGGGKDASRLEEALASVTAFVSDKLGL